MVTKVPGNMTDGVQPAAAALSAIAELTPAELDFLQFRDGAWTNRTPAEISDDLDLGSGTFGTAAALDAGTSAGNVPVLDGSAKLPTSILPAMALTDTHIVASQAAMLALSAQQGDIAIRTDINRSFVLSSNSPSTLADWKELLTPTDAVLSVAGLTGAITASGLKSALNLVVGTDVQAHSAVLDAIALLTGAANDDIIQKKGGSFVNRTMAQLLTDLAAAGAATIASGILTVPATSSGPSEIRLREDTDNGTNHVGLKAPAVLAGDAVWEMPAADGSANQVLKTNGSKVLFFGDAAGGAMEIVGTFTASAATSLTITDGFDADYDEYIFCLRSVVISTASVLTCKVSDNGGSSFLSSLYSSVVGPPIGSNSGDTTNTSDYRFASSTSSNNMSGFLRLIRSTSSITSFISWLNIVGTPFNIGCGSVTTSSEANAIRFASVSGTITGAIDMYRMKNV